jgi:hypothetical protein
VVVTGFHIDDITFVGEGNQSARHPTSLEPGPLYNHAPY